MLTKRREKRNVFVEKEKDSDTLRVKQECEDIFSVRTKIIVQRHHKAVDASNTHRLDRRMEEEEEERIRQDERTLAIEEDRKVEGRVTKGVRGGYVNNERECRQTADNCL